MKDDILSIKDAVEECLKEDHRTRDDDKWLIIQVLRKLDFDIYIPYDKLDEMPAFESITRCRRKFQEEGKYEAKESIKERRNEEKIKMDEINKWYYE